MRRAKFTLATAATTAVVCITAASAAASQPTQASISGATRSGSVTPDVRASASRFLWYNTAFHVAEILYYFRTTPDGVGFSYVRCQGLFSHPFLYRRGKYWFHRLRCSAKDYEARWFGIAVTVNGRETVYARQTWCHDAESYYSCPGRNARDLARNRSRSPVLG